MTQQRIKDVAVTPKHYAVVPANLGQPTRSRDNRDHRQRYEKDTLFIIYHTKRSSHHPRKEMMILRILRDASSHFKEAPSLNDVLYQGQFKLPEIYAV
ncbi:hypothetical protein NECAME_00389 [Necator americanus]|uniref:Uncharacterized protein n=1 Tax=Necator americanus TaxID=51031 RepID=W2TAF2_NECAM|nr:hypothetical protein NECAME_00389 [Necator americanus]ETN79015.1 hypothetical protein NECAME_00389 [Necator americanus]